VKHLLTGNAALRRHHSEIDRDDGEEIQKGRGDRNNRRIAVSRATGRTAN